MGVKYSPEQIQELLDGIYSGKITEYNIPKGLYQAIGNYLQEGLFKGFGKNFETAAGDDLELLDQLNQNIWMFSAAKSFQELKDIRSLMFDPITKKLVGAREFNALGSKAYDNWNNNWGRSEYETAVGQGQMAVYWNDIQKNKDILPYLIYDTKGNPCPDCKPFEGFTAHANDPIWKWLFPLMHFNCGCTVRQETDSHPLSDNEFRDKVNNLKETVPEVFQMNAGRDKYIFDPNSHPYFKVAPKEEPFARQNFGLPVPEPEVKDVPYKGINVESKKWDDSLHELSPAEHQRLLDITGVPEGLKGDAQITLNQSGSYTVSVHGGGLHKTQIVYDWGSISNSSFYFDDHSGLKDLETEIFHNQVENAVKHGFKEITGYFNKDYYNYGTKEFKPSDAIYSGARLGYVPNGVKQEQAIGKVIKAFNKEYKVDVKDLGELMGTKTGQEYWKEKGIQWNGKFDLTAGSYSRKTLDNLISGKQELQELPAPIKKVSKPKVPKVVTTNPFSAAPSAAPVYTDVEKAKEALSEMTFSSVEKSAVSSYSGSSYSSWNEYLRRGKRSWDEEKEVAGWERGIKNLNSFLDKAPKFQGITYRGLSFNKEEFENFLTFVKDNEHVIDKGFMSTTYNQTIMNNFSGGRESYSVKMEIEGRSGVPIEQLSNYPSEKEILFKSGTKLRIKSYDINNNTLNLKLIEE